MLSTCRKRTKVNNICRLAIEVTFHTVQNLTDYSLSLRPPSVTSSVDQTADFDFSPTPSRSRRNYLQQVEIYIRQTLRQNYTDRKRGFHYWVSLFSCIKLFTIQTFTKLIHWNI